MAAAEPTLVSAGGSADEDSRAAASRPQPARREGEERKFATDASSSLVTGCGGKNHVISIVQCKSSSFDCLSVHGAVVC